MYAPLVRNVDVRCTTSTDLHQRLLKPQESGLYLNGRDENRVFNDNVSSMLCYSSLVQLTCFFHLDTVGWVF